VSDASREREVPAVPIRSADDPRIELFRGIRDRDLRGAHGRFLAESERVARRLLRSRFEVESMLLNESALARLEGEIAARPSPPTVFVVPDGLETEIAGCRFHGGTLAIGIRPRRPPAAIEWVDAVSAGDGPRRVLMACGVTHADNIGSIFRSAACLGASGVMLDGGCADPLLRSAIRFSMGRVFSVPWTVCDPIEAAWDRLRSHGFSILAAELAAAAMPIRELPSIARAAVAVGAEGRGLPPPLLAAADMVVRLPAAVPPGEHEPASLNVAVASAVLLYELSR
jgi:tRNA G18 (ribose-2'-O)-methylase SpoU